MRKYSIGSLLLGIPLIMLAYQNCGAPNLATQASSLSPLPAKDYQSFTDILSAYEAGGQGSAGNRSASSSQSILQEPGEMADHRNLREEFLLNYGYKLNRAYLAYLFAESIPEVRSAALPKVQFSDVDPASPLSPHIHKLFAVGLTTGCSVNGNVINYCPDETVAVWHALVMRARAFVNVEKTDNYTLDALNRSTSTFDRETQERLSAVIRELQLAYDKGLFEMMGIRPRFADLNRPLTIGEAIKLTSSALPLKSCLMHALCEYEIFEAAGQFVGMIDSYSLFFQLGDRCMRVGSRSPVQKTASFGGVATAGSQTITNRTCRVTGAFPKEAGLPQCPAFHYRGRDNRCEPMYLSLGTTVLGDGRCHENSMLMTELITNAKTCGSGAKDAGFVRPDGKLSCRLAWLADSCQNPQRQSREVTFVMHDGSAVCGRFTLDKGTSRTPTGVAVNITIENCRFTQHNLYSAD
jgi:hypothetical protein